MEIIKKEYKAILLVLGYISFAELVYITLMVNLTHKWYLAVIVGLAILIVGSIIGFFYVKGEYRKHKETEEKNSILKEETIEVEKNN